MTDVSAQTQIEEQIPLPNPGALSTDAAFTVLVERHSRFVFKVAYALLRNAFDSDDVVQETFLKVYRAKSWHGIRDERAFLARAAWRIAITRLNVKRRSQSIATSRFDAASNDPTPEQALIAGNWNRAVHRLIDALPEDLRQPLALSTLDELTSHEIAAIMGIPSATVRSRLMRARQILQQKLSALTEGHHDK